MVVIVGVIAHHGSVPREVEVIIHGWLVVDKVIHVRLVEVIHGVHHLSRMMIRHGVPVHVIRHSATVHIHVTALLLHNSNLLLRHLLPPLPLLLVEQNLLHLGSTLPQRLGGLLASPVVSHLEPEVELLVLLEESTVHVSDGLDDGTGDGGLVVLLGLEVGPAVGVDEVAEATIAGMNVGASASAAEDIVLGVEFDAYLGGGYHVTSVEGGGSVGAVFDDRVIRLGHHWTVVISRLGLAVGKGIEVSGDVHAVGSHRGEGRHGFSSSIGAVRAVVDRLAHFIAEPRQVTELTGVVVIRDVMLVVVVHEQVAELMIHCRKKEAMIG